MKNRLKVPMILTLVVLISTASVQSATYIFSSAGQSITESFTGYAGTTAPTDWVLLAPPTGTQAPYYGQIGSSVSTSVGWRSYGVTSPEVSADRALGFLGNSNSNPATMTASYMNNTGTTLSSISVGYTGEQWLAQYGRNTKISVSYSLDDVTYIQLSSLTFTAPVILEDGATALALDGNLTANRIVFNPVVVTPSGGIENGSTFYLRFTYDRSNGSGVAQGLAIDDVIVTAVPEPATAVLLFGSGLMVLAYRWRRRCNRRS